LPGEGIADGDHNFVAPFPERFDLRGAPAAGDQPAAARFIAGKLYRYYVADDPPPGEELIQPLADELRRNDFRIEVAIRRILTSNIFYSEAAFGRKIRSPIEIAVGLLRTLGVTYSTTELARQLQPLGQLPFYPPNVKGWVGGKSWINSTTMLGRTNLVLQILRDESDQLAEGALGDLSQRYSPSEAAERVDALAELLLAVPLAEGPQVVLIEVAEEHRQNSQEQIAELIHLLSALPEFHLT